MKLYPTWKKKECILFSSMHSTHAIILLILTGLNALTCYSVVSPTTIIVVSDLHWCLNTLYGTRITLNLPWGTIYLYKQLQGNLFNFSHRMTLLTWGYFITHWLTNLVIYLEFNILIIILTTTTKRKHDLTENLFIKIMNLRRKRS